MNLVFSNRDGDEITGARFAVIMLLVMPSNFFILSYFAMILSGALHSGVVRFPALGFWSSACAVALFQILGWKKGPITYKGTGI